MNKKLRINLLIAVLLIAGLALSACERSASTPPPNETQVESIIVQAATLTTEAQEGIGGGASFESEQTAEAPVTVFTATPTTAPPTATPMPTAITTVPQSYTLHKGEFPFCLARRFNVDVTTLLNVNGLSRGATYYPGLTLTIPQDAPDFQGNRMLRNHPVEYTVTSGDTFYSIACLFGDVFPEEIASHNNKGVDDTLTAGTTINIP